MGHPRHMSADELARFRRPREEEPRRRRWVPRSRGGRVAAIATVIVLLAAGTALALFLLRGGFTGSVTQGSWSLVLSGAPEPTTASGGCEVSRDPTASGGVEGQVAIDWQAAELDECEIDAQWHPPLDGSNSTDVVLQGFTAPAGIAASVNGACGTVVTPTMTADLGANPAPHVTVTLTVEAGAPASIAFDPALHGAEWVRADDFDPLLCS